MEHLLTDPAVAQNVWEFPSINTVDRSMSSNENVSVLEDSHGHGDLSSANRLQFTTKDRDVWLWPSQSYLKLQVEITPEDGSNYTWANATQKSAQDGIDRRYVKEAMLKVHAADPNNPTPDEASKVKTIVSAICPSLQDKHRSIAETVSHHDVSLTDNATALFSTVRYYVEDKEIERLDHVNIGTLVDGLLQQNKSEEDNVIRHSQLWFLNDDHERKAYIHECDGKLSLTIPLSRLFTFAKFVTHAFRGTTHRIALDLDTATNLIIKGATTKAAKIKVKKAEWIIPKVAPSMAKAAEMELALASNATDIRLQWPMTTVYREQSPQANKDVRIQIQANIHRPIRVLIGFQYVDRYAQNEMSKSIFDQLNVEEVAIMLNSKRFPSERRLTADFTQLGGALELYNKFLQACQGGDHCAIDYETFRDSFPLWHVPLTARDEEIYDTSSFPLISVLVKFRTAPTKPYYTYVILQNERTGQLNIIDKKMSITVG